MNESIKQKYELVLPNLPIRQIIIDIESYERKMKDLERLLQSSTQFVDKNEITLLWMEVVTRKDLLKQLILLPYEPQYELQMEEKVILQKFFYESNGYSWKSANGWIGQTANVARLAIEQFDSSTSLFEGVKLVKAADSLSNNDCYVKEISLPGHGCEGEINSSFESLLRRCSFFNLNWNILSGYIANFNFYSCRNLMTLELAGNELIGGLDANTFQFVAHLRVLDLSFNQLSGELPDQVFANLSQLEKLNLSNNRFEGELPISIKKLIHLQELKLYKNQFHGEIKDDLFAPLKDLIHVNLSHNR